MEDHSPSPRALYEKSGGESFGLSEGEFTTALREVAAKYLPADAPAKQAADFYGSLRLEDLALARACALGIERAWELFLNRYRAKLFDAALSIAREDSAARELADSVYASLFGTKTSDGGIRVSKLASYTGRGSLEGWLRTVLAQEYVNRYRRERRLVSLDEETCPAGPIAPANTQVCDPRIAKVIDGALEQVPASERLILSAYFLDGRTLAEIGIMVGVHESTVSRRLDRTIRALRKQTLRGLRKMGMSARQAEEAMQTDVRDLAVDVRARLTQEIVPQSFHKEGSRILPGEGPTGQ